MLSYSSGIHKRQGSLFNSSCGGKTTNSGIFESEEN